MLLTLHVFLRASICFEFLDKNHRLRPYSGSVKFERTPLTTLILTPGSSTLVEGDGSSMLLISRISLVYEDAREPLKEHEAEGEEGALYEAFPHIALKHLPSQPPAPAPT